MTEIIPGLQGDIPAKSRKGIPFVAEQYVLKPLFLFIPLINNHLVAVSFERENFMMHHNDF